MRKNNRKKRRSILKSIGAIGLGTALPSMRSTATQPQKVPPGLAEKVARQKLIEVAGTDSFESWVGASLSKRQKFYMTVKTGATRSYKPSAYVFDVVADGIPAGYITVGAQRWMAPVLEYSTAPSPTSLLDETEAAAQSRGMRSTGRPLYHGGVKYDIELGDGKAVNVRDQRLSVPGETSVHDFQFDEATRREEWRELEDTFGSSPPGGGDGGASDPSCGLCDHVSGVPCWTSTDEGGANSTDFGTGKDSWQKWDGCSPIAGSMIVGYHEGYSGPDERERAIDKLHETMNTGEASYESPGLTSSEDLAPGFDNYTDGSNSYDGTLVYGADAEFVLEELGNQNRPYLLSFLSGGRAEDYSTDKDKYGDHSVTVVGQYDFVDELQIHDTWNYVPHRLTYGNWAEKWSVRVEVV